MAGDACAESVVVAIDALELRFLWETHHVRIGGRMCITSPGCAFSDPQRYRDLGKCFIVALVLAVRGMFCGRRGSMTFTVWLLLHRRGLAIAACRISLSDWLHRMVTVCKTVAS